MEHQTGTERVGETVRTGPWLQVYEDLSGRDPVSLGAVELDALAEGAWWLCKTDESIAARQRAYAAFREAKDDRGAARTAARLFHDHFYRGEGAVAVGWLRRGFRHLERDPDCVEWGWLRMAEAELHLHQGPLEQAVDGAAHAVQVARHHGDADLAAVAMQIQGRALVAQGRIDEGLGLLDEAMTCVLAGELAPLYTGWVYCSVILACKDLADLQRASEWTEAARVVVRGAARDHPLQPGPVPHLPRRGARVARRLGRSRSRAAPRPPGVAAPQAAGRSRGILWGRGGPAASRRSGRGGAGVRAGPAAGVGSAARDGVAAAGPGTRGGGRGGAAVRAGVAHGGSLRAGAAAGRPGRGRDRGRRARRRRPCRPRAGDDRRWPPQRGGSCDRGHGPGRAPSCPGGAGSRVGAARRCPARLAGAPAAVRGSHRTAVDRHHPADARRRGGRADRGRRRPSWVRPPRRRRRRGPRRRPAPASARRRGC